MIGNKQNRLKCKFKAVSYYEKIKVIFNRLLFSQLIV